MGIEPHILTAEPVMHGAVKEPILFTTEYTEHTEKASYFSLCSVFSVGYIFHFTIRSMFSRFIHWRVGDNFSGIRSYL